MTNVVDVVRLALRYRRRVGRWPNFLRPTYFTEKVQVAKLTWRSPRMLALADKVEAKKVVAGLLGPGWITPTLYAGPDLPPRAERNWPVPYVIKANHSSGWNLFITNPADADWDAIEPQVQRWMRSRYGTRDLEWVYQPMVPQVLVEPYIGGAQPPADYRLHVFGGRTEFVSVNWNMFGGLKRFNYDRDWNPLPFVISGLAVPDYGDDIPPRPESFDEMLRAAELLARGFPFARVDFYEIDGRPRFGEVTFYPSSGLFRMDPEFDRKYGALWPAGVPE